MGPAIGAPTQGFCLVSTAALIADMLSGRSRVAVIDFDVHPGNGTQKILMGRLGSCMWTSTRTTELYIPGPGGAGAGGEEAIWST